MANFALINAVSPSPVIRRASFVGDPPELPAAKGIKWIPDNPPSIASHQRLVATEPVPVDATEVAYTVETDPSRTESVATQNARQKVVRTIAEIRERGDLESRVEALELIIKESRLWP